MSKRHYSPEFKQEAACLVLDQNYTMADACEAMGVGRTALTRWVSQLRHERSGETPLSAKAITQEHREIQALKEQVRRLQREKDILKKASALLMSEAFSV
jgi:transposase